MNHQFQRVMIAVLLLCGAVTTAPAQTNAGREKNIAAYRAQIWNKPPAAGNWVNDFEGILNAAEEQRLNMQLSAYEQKTGIELSVVTIDTMMVAAARFDSFAVHLFNTWGVGKKDKNNGVLVCMSRSYRKIRICNGTGITPKLSDAATKKIVDESFIPRFKEGAYARGIEEGVNALMKALE